MGTDKIFLSFLCLTLAGCTLGPDFTPPENTLPPSYIRNGEGDVPSKVLEGEAPDPEWWRVLHDDLLNRLVAQVASENLDALAATSRIEQSRAQRGITASEFYPQVNGDTSYNHEKLSDKGVISLVGGGMGGASGGAGGASGSGAGAMSPGIPSSKTPAFDVYQYGFDVSWEIDIWGRVRRGVEAADATVQAAQDDRRGLAISTIAELVRDYVQLRGTQASLDTLYKDLRASKETAALVAERYRAGLGNDIDVANASAQAASIQAQIPQMEQQQTSLMNAIALLLAKPPGALDQQLSQSHALPPLPPQVPIGVPSELVQRRPDIRAAANQLHAATAEIGVAKAEFFPKITLMGNGMMQALDVGDLANWAAHSYTFGPSVTLPIFEGGRLASTLELREASQQEAALQYRKAVLTAFHEVDNALTAYRAEQQRRSALAEATEQNRKALALATDLYKQGLGDFLTVLTDEQNVLGTEQQTIQSNATTSVNMVQLYKALGGGWETDFPDPLKDRPAPHS